MVTQSKPIAPFLFWVLTGIHVSQTLDPQQQVRCGLSPIEIRRQRAGSGIIQPATDCESTSVLEKRFQNR